MKGKKVIDYGYMPGYPPLTFTAVIYLLLEHFQSPGWFYGFGFTVVGLWWLAYLAGICTQTRYPPGQIKE